jgi:hypothetical protein
MTADPLADAVIERLPDDSPLRGLPSPEHLRDAVDDVLGVLRGLGAVHDPTTAPMTVQEMCDELADLAGLPRYARGVQPPRGPAGILASRADFTIATRAALGNAVGADAQHRANALVAALDQELRARITAGKAYR